MREDEAVARALQMKYELEEERRKRQIEKQVQANERIARQFQIEEQINERNRRNKTGRRTAIYSPAQEKIIADGKSLYSILSPSELKEWAKGWGEKINMSESRLLQAIKP